ncbi:MAG TPA: HAD hydrolase family protein [Roseiflexaceae bacterium]|nr:HAD hydrolase family protein [Roseiflexaceae bacterium]
MHVRVFVSDLDGTLTEHDQVSPATWHMLHQARVAGFKLILCTGRILDTFAPDGLFAETFDAIVAEDGAVVYFPRSDTVLLPFGHLPAGFTERLDALQLPIERGMVLVATHVPHDVPILELLRQMGGGAVVEYNRGAVMVLPQGATKAAGLDVALRELGLSPRNVIACGDAENDRSMLQLAECGVAVANAVPTICETADLVLPLAGGAGVRGLISELIAGQLPRRRLRPERQLLLGQQLDGSPFAIDPWLLISGVLGIAGDSQSGKSWLSGLLAELLIGLGYQMLIIDPEGDYRALAGLPHTILVGAADTQLRRVGDVMTICEYAQSNLVIDLSDMPHFERIAFADRLLHELYELRIQRGRPHWILIDEIQQLCPVGEQALSALVLRLMAQGGVSIVSHRPSEVDPVLLQAVSLWGMTRLTSDEDLMAFDRLLAACPDWAIIRDKVTQLVRGQAHLLCRRGSGGAPETTPAGGTFRGRTRPVSDIRPLHKYLRPPLPRERWFYFRTPHGKNCGAAANLSEFRQMLAELPIESLRFHLENGDFERWLTDVIHDTELSPQIRKVLRHHPGSSELRLALQTAVGVRYDELANLL